MKKLGLFISLQFFICILYANDSFQCQEDTTQHWSFYNSGRLYFSQNAYSKYWKGSGVNTLSSGVEVMLNAKYKNEKHQWFNGFDLRYGVIQKGKNELLKNVDKLEFNSNYSWDITELFKISALYQFRTMFHDTYKIDKEGARSKLTGGFLAPMIVSMSAGLDYRHKNKHLNLFYTPVSAKLTYVKDTALLTQYLPKMYHEDQFRTELGSLLKIVVNYPLMKNVLFISTTDLFSNHMEELGTVDINFEGRIKMKVNKLLTIDVLTQIVYDADVQFDIVDAEGAPTGKKGPRTQFSEALNIGFTRKF